MSSRPVAVMPDAPAEVCEDGQLNEVAGCYASGVVVVTASGPDGPAGMTVSSFTQLSVDPPLVLFCASDDSTTWPRIRDCGAFAVNILRHDQGELARTFAQRSADRFTGVRPGRSRSGLPVLPGVLAYLDCQIDALWPGGDHTVVVGRVRGGARLADGRPLLRFRGQLC